MEICGWFTSVWCLGRNYLTVYRLKVARNSSWISYQAARKQNPVISKKAIVHSLKEILLDCNIDYLFNLSLFYTDWAERRVVGAVWLAAVRTATPLMSVCVCVCLIY